MYTYRCHNKKHVHVPLSQYKTCTATAFTTQNMYTYRCHNTKHVQLQLSQHKTCTRIAVTIQNMYSCHYLLLILLHTLKILVFLDVSPFNRFKAFKTDK